MQFSRWFPMTGWVWRQRLRIACVVLLFSLLWMLLLTGTNLIYLLRANRVLNLVLTVRPEADGSTEAALKRYCSLPEAVPGTTERIWICSNGYLFHPELRVAANYDLDADTHELRSVGSEVLLPRREAEPFYIEVQKNLKIEGTAVRVQTPPHGITLYLERDAAPKVRVNYKCSLPFVKCDSLDDFVTR